MAATRPNRQQRVFSSLPLSPPNSAPVAGAVRAYLVEDNALARERLISVLGELAQVVPVGYADSEQQGREWLEQADGAWDLAIVDLYLRRGTGLGVLRACRGRAPEHKVIVVSNDASADMRARCLALGADAVFDKSLEIDALVAYCQSLGAGRA